MSEDASGAPEQPQIGDFEPTLGAAAPDVEAVLPWREVIGSLAAMFRLSGRVIFRRKLLFMTAGIAAYYAILYAFAVYQPNSGFGVEDALFVLVELPGTVMGVYLAMYLIAKERDLHTLEVLFSTASSHYTVWTIRLLSVYFVLLVTLLIMSAASYFLFAEFPFFWGGLNAFLPAFLIANLTFYFSVFTRSANAAGMLAGSAGAASACSNVPSGIWLSISLVHISSRSDSIRLPCCHNAMSSLSVA